MIANGIFSLSCPKHLGLSADIKEVVIGKITNFEVLNLRPWYLNNDICLNKKVQPSRNLDFRLIKQRIFYKF